MRKHKDIVCTYMKVQERKFQLNKKEGGIIRKLTDYKTLFIEKGYIPLEDIPNTKTKIECIDKDGYKYYTTYDVLRDKRSLPFDFKVDWNEKTILIEVDGQQHYYISKWNPEDSYKSQIQRDEIKTNYCKKHGYVLLRIPCWDFARDTYKRKLHETFFG